MLLLLGIKSNFGSVLTGHCKQLLIFYPTHFRGIYWWCFSGSKAVWQPLEIKPLPEIQRQTQRRKASFSPFLLLLLEQLKKLYKLTLRCHILMSIWELPCFWMARWKQTSTRTKKRSMEQSLSTRLKHSSTQEGSFLVVTYNGSSNFSTSKGLCSPLRKMIFLNANSSESALIGGEFSLALASSLAITILQMEISRQIWWWCTSQKRTQLTLP